MADPSSYFSSVGQELTQGRAGVDPGEYSEDYEIDWGGDDEDMASALGEGDEFGFGATGEEEEATGEGNDEEEGGSDEDVDIFVGEMDPMAFLRRMESAGGERDGARAVEMIAQARQQAMSAAFPELRQGGSEDSDPDFEPETYRRGRGRPPGRGRGRERGSGRGRGRPPGSSRGPGRPPEKRNLFGATVEDIYDSELFPSSGRRKRRRRKTKERNPLPEDIRDMLAKATEHYALGRQKQAASLLSEVIRRTPNHPDAYRLMGLLNEDANNKRRALAFFMLEAHLTKKDAEPWRRVARLSVELGLRRQAVYCLSKVMLRAKTDLDARYDKAVLLMELGEPIKAVIELERLQRISDGNPDIPKNLARLYHTVNKPRKAAEALEAHLHSFPHKSDLTHVNMLCELYMQLQKYSEAAALINRAQEVLCADGEVPIDLQVKRGMCNFKTGKKETAIRELQGLIGSDECGDLLEQVAGMYLEAGEHQRALLFYEQLLDQSAERSPEVVRNASICYKELGDFATAVRLYEDTIANMDPSDKNMLECLLLLCELKLEMGQQEEAQQIIARAMQKQPGLAIGEHVRGEGLAELRVWLAKTYLRLDDRGGFLETLLPCVYATLKSLESRLCPTKKIRDVSKSKETHSLRLVLQRRKKLRDKGQLGRDGGLFTPAFTVLDRRFPHLKILEQQYAPIIEEMEKAMEISAQSKDETHQGLVIEGLFHKDGKKFGLFLQVIWALIDSNDPEALDEANDLTKQALDLLSLDKGALLLLDNLRLFSIEIKCRLSTRLTLRHDISKTIQRWPTSIKLLNLYSQILCKNNGQMRVTRVVVTMRSQYPNCMPLMLLAGHHHVSSNSIAEAINEYVHAFHHSPDEPLVSLCLAVVMLKDAMAFRAPHRHRSILQAFAFLCKYRKLRGNPQEAAYNMGRAAHDLGLFHVAVPFYEEVLMLHKKRQAEPGADGGGEGFPDPTSDLSREAAHNLVMIYKASGSILMARRIMEEYLCV